MPVYPKSKGFTLIEIILAIAIVSIISITIFSILDLATRIYEMSEKSDEVLLNGRYGIEYIKNEIRLADKIISSNKISGLNTKYPYNLGFVLLNIKSNEYTYITYYLGDDKLIRIACTTTNDEYPSSGFLDGHNHICEYICSVDGSKLDADNSMICLNFKLGQGGKELSIKSDIYIRCPTDF